jgi:hypothetical protein
MKVLDSRTGALALVAMQMRAMNPALSTADAVTAAADFLDAAAAEIVKRDDEYRTVKDADGLTAEQRDLGFTPELLEQRRLALVPEMLPAIALVPGNDQLQVLGEIHANIDAIEALRAEALAAVTSQAPGEQLLDAAMREGKLFAKLAEFYPGVANELLTYVLHSVSGGPGLTDAKMPAADATTTAADLAGLPTVDAATGDRRVPGPYIPPDSSRDTTGDAQVIAADVAAQDQGRTAANLGAAPVAEDNGHLHGHPHQGPSDAPQQ